MENRIKEIRLTKQTPFDLWLNKKGEPLDSRQFDANHLLGAEPVDVYKPDGSPLLLLRKEALPLEVVNNAYPSLRLIGSRYSHKRKLNSGIFGSDIRPVCRKSEFTARDVDRYVKMLPFVDACNTVFRHENRKLQGRYGNQRHAAYRTDPFWTLGDTAFTTGTANLWDDAGHDARTLCHVDARDLKDGFGVITVIRRGNYRGGYLIFPAFRVAVDLHTRDVLLADVHEWHGNAPIEGEPSWERLSVILYYMTEMRNCSSPDGA